ncbi:MAG: hypothetical protein U1C74_21715, partial [Phenylobacterium sp.]|nr:hypothetical protein [Phenylobacterium sp.]
MRRLDRDGYGQLLLSWVAGELSGLYRQHVESAAPGTLLIGGAAWGPLYIARWLHLGARTLLSKRNAQALKGRCRILL